jgi:hypothetical protein
MVAIEQYESLGSTVPGRTFMPRKRDLVRVLGHARDFVCAFTVFFGLAFVLMADKTYPFPPAMISLISGSSMGSGAPALRGWGEIGPGVVAALDGVQAYSGPFVLALLATIFAAIVTLNLAILRHLRRVHTSSRRSAWRQD